MGPKKRSDARTRKGASSSSGSSRPAKGVAQVQLSAENQQRLRRLIQNTNLHHASTVEPPPSMEPLSQLEKQKASRRLHHIYEKLASEGFSTAQIELGLSSLPPGEATLEAVLDWLCLNLPGDKLPKKFSSGGVNVDIEGASVQLLSAAKEDWVPNAHPDSILKKDDGLELVIKTTTMKEDDGSKDMQQEQAEWIRQYMSKLTEDEQGGSAGSSSDVDSDWEVLAQPQIGQKHGTARETVSNPETRALSIASEFQAAKAAAADAKQKGDKQKQAVSGQLIRKLKQEMAALGLSEEILSASSGTVESMVSTSGVNVDGCMVEQTSKDYDTRENIHLNMTMDICGGDSPKRTTRGRIKHEKDLSESEDEVFGMFDEENATQKVLPSTIIDMQNKEKAMAWASQTSDKKHLQQKEKKVLKQESTQRQPKALLQQQCQKRGWGIPKYERGSESSTLYAYNVTVIRPSSGRGKSKVVGGKNTFTIPGEVAGFKSIEEAQNMVATWALFSLFPELPLYHIMPEPYRAMMLQWHAQGSETTGKDALEQNRRSTFIELLVNSQEQREETERDHASMLPSKFSDSNCRRDEALSVDERVELNSTAINSEESSSRLSQDQDAESNNLLRRYQEKKQRKSYKDMMESRARLPIFSAKDEVIQQICSNPVVVISGETGSGKTTQVPQYILEGLIASNQGAFCNIVCTQPRRLAAISIAERVALEQGDGPPGSKGSLVGHQVRLDSARHQGTKLLFCTTGILLRRLAGDHNLTGVSHVIVDEVHERSVLGDFTLIILKDIIERRRINKQLPLKIILMSATVDASIFSCYFGNCPVVKVQGRTFPVETIYLEDIYEMMDYHLGSDSPAALKNSSSKHRSDKVSSNLVNSSRGRQNLVQYGWGDDEMLDEEVCNPHFDEELYKNYSLKTKKNLRQVNEEIIDFDLLEELIMYIDKKGEEGAILVFLPGMGDILSIINRLVSSEHFRGDLADWILPLHSSISVDEQQRAFQCPPSGVRKIVAATNIAETSITIEDVVHVIDCGKHKELQFDARRGMSRMEEAWVSQANIKQRCGRAGRVQPGYCFSLYTKYRYQKLLRPFQLPEMLRVPLVELCLQIKFLSLGHIESFLAKAIDRPKPEAVNSAISTLHEVGAFDANEELTVLGFHLAKLPVDVHIGKMIIYGAILGCLSPILTIAACLSYKSPFSVPRNQISATTKAKRGFVDGKKCMDKSSSICIGQQSDQLAMAAAYKSWCMVLKKQGERAGYDYCKANFLNIPTLVTLRDIRLQFGVLLADIGFLSPQEVNAIKTYNLDQWFDDTQRPFNCNAHLPCILKATMCAGLYPNVVKMDDESIRLGHANALSSRAGLASSQRVIWTDGRQECFIHPSSVNHQVSEFRYPFMVYHEKVKTSKVYIRDTTAVSAYTLLLFGGAISVQHQTGQVSVDGWLKMEAPAQTAVLFKELRTALDSVLQELIKNPKNSVGNSGKDVVTYIVKLLMDEEKVQQ